MDIPNNRFHQMTREELIRRCEQSEKLFDDMVAALEKIEEVLEQTLITHQETRNTLDHLMAIYERLFEDN